MNVLFVTQCDKRALKETRRILDQFAERKGARTWQTSITQIGLDTVRKLLRQTARRNTAVACHWLHGQGQCDVVWIVGDASRFNTEGTVPTHTTERNILRQNDENDWATAEDIRLLAQMAALLHDLGKASVEFQNRLRTRKEGPNLYRHEWVSLRLFQAFVGAETDSEWLTRLATEQYTVTDWTAAERYQQDGINTDEKYPFRKLPPLAAALGWLVVTHHRLPVAPAEKQDGSGQEYWGKRRHKINLGELEQPLADVTHAWNTCDTVAPIKERKPYWQLQEQDNFPVLGKQWRVQAAKLARKLLVLEQKRAGQWMQNSYVLHLARLSLILADHYYSSLSATSGERVQGDGPSNLYANTDSEGALKQTLSEHLLGVARNAGLVAYAMPSFEQYLPRLARHKGLRRRSNVPRFAWQDNATDAAIALRENSFKKGLFCICMASTGTGKTLAGAKIMNALADPQKGVRFTYALGLRALTLQTGRAYQKILHLTSDDLAILVGGTASKALFDFYQAKAEVSGSESSVSLLEEDSYVSYEGCETNHPLLSRVMHDPQMRQFLSAPAMVCTVDHMVPATECSKGGRHIAPMLRLMSSDLILDELDDYDLKDMPALTRLVYWAGLLGSRVLLSSATLPPSLVFGMYQAYRAGRQCYMVNHDASGAASEHEIPCLWVDEFGVSTKECFNITHFEENHALFIKKRSQKLLEKPAVCKGEIQPLSLLSQKIDKKFYKNFADVLRSSCVTLHKRTAGVDAVSGSKVSFGLVRMANIDPLFHVAQALFALGGPEGVHIHLCVYHARFPLVQRSAIENMLDTAFNRRVAQQAVYALPSVRAALNAYPQKEHIFIVLASPVCEVGRDWDADWAVAEPSSVRALIQLAGRVQRHRRIPATEPNFLILDTALKYFKKKTGAIFSRPGFERGEGSVYHLSSHWMHDVLRPDEYQALTALPRVAPQPYNVWQPQHKLADLEQACMRDSLLPPPVAPPNRRGIKRVFAPRVDMAALCWQYPHANLTGVLPQEQPFRESTEKEDTLVFLPNEETEDLSLYREEQQKNTKRDTLYIPVEASRWHTVTLNCGPNISVWGVADLNTLLQEQAENLDMPLSVCARRMATVTVRQNTQGWLYHHALGFATNHD